MDKSFLLFFFQKKVVVLKAEKHLSLGAHGLLKKWLEEIILVPLAFEHVQKTSIGIHCGFVPQLHAAQVRADFEQMIVWVSSYKALLVVSP